MEKTKTEKKINVKELLTEVHPQGPHAKYTFLQNINDFPKIFQLAFRRYFVWRDTLF